MLFFSWNKNKEERKGNKETETRKQTRKTGRNKERKEEERHREKAIEKGGGPKKLRINKGRHSNINKKMPFSRGKKQGFFY